MSSIGSILASQALKNIYLTKWTFGGPLNVREWSKLYFHLETCRLRIQEYYIDDNFVEVVYKNLDYITKSLVSGIIKIVKNYCFATIWVCHKQNF